jgi:hypothetical protein
MIKVNLNQNETGYVINYNRRYTTFFLASDSVYDKKNKVWAYNCISGNFTVPSVL